jgi:cytochrome c-type biogenesis protein CcmH
VDGSALTDPREAELDARAAEVAGELRCPVCRNQSVLESNAELSREMQNVVRERLAAGETPEEVKAYFVSRYGEWILLQPRARGINLLVYGLPALALIAGFLIARNRLRKWAATGGAAVTGPQQSGLSAADEEWLREALRES